MTTTSSGLMTADQFYDWVHRPENSGRSFELDRGEVVEMARPGERHGVVCGNVVWVLGGYVRQQGRGYVCANDTGVLWERDPDTVKGPDVLYFEQPRKYEELNPKYTEELPLLVVEVLSPNDRVAAATRRASHFLAWGVPLVWLVDPEDCTVTIHRSGGLPRVCEGNDTLSDELLPHFRCSVSDLFFVPGQPASPTSGSAVK
jgi:Uma2 family endonuclease